MKRSDWKNFNRERPNSRHQFYFVWDTNGDFHRAVWLASAGRFVDMERWETLDAAHFMEYVTPFGPDDMEERHDAL